MTRPSAEESRELKTLVLVTGPSVGETPVRSGQAWLPLRQWYFASHQDDQNTRTAAPGYAELEAGAIDLFRFGLSAQLLCH